MRIERADLVRYAGASLDFNPIHWDGPTAASAGLPGVIAHGMLVMAVGGRLLAEWVGDPGAVREYGVVFTRPVPVPDVGGILIAATGRVTHLGELGATASVGLTVSSDGRRVLGRATGVVSLA